MPRIQFVAVETLRGLGLGVGDTLSVLAEEDSSFKVSVSHNAIPSPKQGLASEWLKSALGSVKLEENESADDVRTKYYAEKYGLDR